jgi:hypothetical protein
VHKREFLKLFTAKFLFTFSEDALFGVLGDFRLETLLGSDNFLEEINVVLGVLLVEGLHLLQ